MPVITMEGFINNTPVMIQMGIIVLIVTGGVGIILVLVVRSMLLRLRLKESLIRQREFDEKNRQLELEISQCRQAGISLISGEEPFRNVVDSILDATIIIDWDGVVLFANSAASQLVGLERPEDGIGLNIASFLHPDSLLQAAQDLKSVREGNSGFPAEYRIIAQGIGERWVSSLGREITFQGRSADLVSLRNITEKKRMEEVLRAAKESAEAANRAKSEFLANMSHELRTPLNAVIGFTEVILNEEIGGLNKTQREYLGDVLQSSRYLLAIIDNILEFSSIDMGGREVRESPLNLADLFASSLRGIEQGAARQRLKLETHLDDIPKTICADEDKLKQILGSLLSNALKFTPGGGSITLSARRWTQGRNPLALNSENGNGNRIIIEIAVEDTGIGIKPKDLMRIFNPFEQVDGSSSRRYPGTGLGLTLVKRLIELHGGSIWATSDGPGMGSIFHFILPCGTIEPVTTDTAPSTFIKDEVSYGSTH